MASFQGAKTKNDPRKTKAHTEREGFPKFNEFSCANRGGGSGKVRQERPPNKGETKKGFADSRMGQKRMRVGKTNIPSHGKKKALARPDR